MRILSGIALLAGLGLTMAVTQASAQGVDLTGQFRCVQMCTPGLQGQPAHVTQNGYNLNLLNEAGEPSRAWIDWNGHIWADNWREGALYSSDGMTIQFDRGTIWQRDLGPQPALPPEGVVTKRITKVDKHGKRVTVTVPAPAPARPVPVRPVPAAPSAPVAAAYDGDWSVLISTQNGGCDRAYRYGVRIAGGNVVYDGGGPVDLQGHVFSNGSVRVSVSGAGQHAEGTGRLTRTGGGNGTWEGQGSLGSCSGVWQAERRG
jgi:hypothetical protein